MSPVDYHGWTHRKKRDGGTDPIYEDEGTTAVWAALSTENSGWEYQGAGADDNVDWYAAFISDAGSSYFGMDFVAAGGQFSDDIVFLTITQSGLYVFTQQVMTSDLNGPTGSNEAFHYQTRLNVCGGAPGNAWGANDNVFPGQIGAVALLQDREQYWISDNSANDLWLNRSWTVPVNHPSPGNERRCGEMRLYCDPQSSDPWFSMRLWIARIGELDWDEATPFALANATWKTGDAIS